MTEIASQTISPTEVDIGDSFTFRVTLDLPAIPAAAKADLTFELFGLDPADGEFSYSKAKIRNAQ